MTAPVQTAGPVDPHASARAKGYGITAVIFGIVALASGFHLITTDQAANIDTTIQDVLTLAGSFGFGFVAVKTNQQVKNGTFDAVPPPPPVPPALTAVEQVKAVGNAFTDFTNTVAQGVQLVQGVAANVPGLSAVVQPGGLVDEFLHGTGN